MVIQRRGRCPSTSKTVRLVAPPRKGRLAALRPHEDGLLLLAISADFGTRLVIFAELCRKKTPAFAGPNRFPANTSYGKKKSQSFTLAAGTSANAESSSCTTVPKPPVPDCTYSLPSHQWGEYGMQRHRAEPADSDPPRGGVQNRCSDGPRGAEVSIDLR